MKEHRRPSEITPCGDEVIHPLSSRGTIAVRWIACFIAGLLNAVDLGFQGNGNLLPSGIFLGFVLGLVWSAILLFGVPWFASKFKPPVRQTLSGAGLLVFFAVAVIVCLHIWSGQ